MDLMQLIQSQLPAGLIDQFSQKYELEPETTEDAVGASINAILAGISNNVSTQQGANSFLEALDRDHDGSILNDVYGYIFGDKKEEKPQTTNGEGILNHVLGDRQTNVIDAISKTLGIDSGKALSILISLAPVVMGMLGRAKQSNGIAGTDLLGLILGGTNQQAQSAPVVEQASSPIGGIFTKLLDRNGDGNVMDDLINMGGSTLLKGLFNK